MAIDGRKNKIDDKTIIFCDMDGVIADFETQAWKTDVIDAQGNMNYDKMDRAWWAGIPAFPGANDFYDFLDQIAPVKFLTGPMMNPDCHAGKGDWIMNFLPEREKFALMDLIICPSKDKCLLAKPNHLLVDDREEVVEAWRNAGGKAILHKGDYEETKKAIKDTLKLPPSLTLKPRRKMAPKPKPRTPGSRYVNDPYSD